MKIIRLTSIAVVGLGALLAPLTLALPAQAATGGSTTINLSSYPVSIGEITTSPSYLGKNGQVKLFFGWSSRYYGSMTKPHLTLQKKTTGSWSNVKATVHLPNAHSDIYVTTPKYALSSSLKSKTVYYRIKSSAFSSAAGRVTNTTYSKSMRLTYENQAKYTGLAKIIYNDAKAYCPNSAVHVGTVDAGEAGQYHFGYFIGVSSVVSSYSAAYQKSVAVHECAHEKQFLNFGGTWAGWKKMTSVSAKYFTKNKTPAGVTPTPNGNFVGTFKALEHAADCAALSVDPSGYLGYGGYCKPSELKHANRLLHGHEY